MNHGSRLLVVATRARSIGRSHRKLLNIPKNGLIGHDTRGIHSSACRRVFIPGLPDQLMTEEENDDDSKNGSKNEGGKNDKKDNGKKRGTQFFASVAKCLETAGIMVASLSVLGLAGLGYHRMYKARALAKMETAFAAEDHPMVNALIERRTREDDDDEWVVREHQETLNDILSGTLSGRYYLLIGEKGTGKTSMLMEAIKRVNGAGCTMMDAHADPEIFRIRLGRALNFEFYEDYLGSLFSIRGPRDTTALLDIERAFDVLEGVAADYVKKNGRPLVLIINNAHLIRDDQDGRNLVELLQQKAEALSGAGFLTMIFNSDDYWLYERLKQLGTRLDVITINDFNREESWRAINRARRKFFNEGVSRETANEVYQLIGGRPQHISFVAANYDMIEACHKLIDREKTWFLNQCGLLGEDMDDDVMESGKFSTSAMFLMKELVRLDKERTSQLSAEELITTDYCIPRIPLWRARQIMTRPDYIQRYDNLNIFTIDSSSRVKADSVVMQRAFGEIASLPGFDELLQETADRVAAIESLGRTRELVAKDLVLAGKYRIEKRSKDGSIIVSLDQPEEEEDEDDGHYRLDYSDKFWWKNRGLDDIKPEDHN